MISIAGDIAQWVAVIVLGGSLFVTRRNAKKNESKNEGVISEKINNLEKLAMSASDKSDKILAGQNEMKEHCARVSTGLTTRVNNLENKKSRRGK